MYYAYAVVGVSKSPVFYGKNLKLACLLAEGAVMDGADRAVVLAMVHVPAEEFSAAAVFCVTQESIRAAPSTR